MADAVVSIVAERLGELLISEATLLRGVSDEIKKVERELERMQCFLEEADIIQNRDKRVRKWVAEIKELAFKIEDVIETFAMDVANKQPRSCLMQMLKKVACFLCELKSRHDIATEINDIKDKLVELTACLQRYGITKGLEEGTTSNSLVNLRSRRIFYSHDVDKDFTGMKEDIDKLIPQLMEADNDCEVISICGMGGQGKTTLAKRLYNHATIRAHFKAFAWVCITQQFDRQKVFRRVLKELGNKEVSEKMTVEELVGELYKLQKETNCLVVIDDIWTVDSWKILKPAFPIGETSSGSKILLTTRYQNVANTGQMHKVIGLTADEGWELLSKKAGIHNLPEMDALKSIGMNMVKRCKLLPLAISSLGGILKGKSLREWEKINKDISFYLAKGERVANDDEYYNVRQVLGLSYDSLPPVLRYCFLCFANYEEDEVISTEDLYMYWMAEGLISVDDKAKGDMMLDVAERYLDELAHRSLVQVETREFEGEYWSKYKTCRIHDLIRDLCLSKVEEEKVINAIHFPKKTEDESQASIEPALCIRPPGDKNVFRPSIVRRLYIRSYYNVNTSMIKPYDQHVISHIRSLLIWKGYIYGIPGVWPEDILCLKKFKLLRVLVVNGYEFKEANQKQIRSISKLVYLKYLSLRHCSLKELPSTIGNLRNLETLDLRLDADEARIPDVLWRLTKLKHLYLPAYKLSPETKLKKLKLKGLNELEFIRNYNSDYCDASDLPALASLKVFDGKFIVNDKFTMETVDFTRSKQMRHTTLHIEGEGESSLALLLQCQFIDDLTVKMTCIIPEAYDHTRTHLSERLTKLCMYECDMEKDPMTLLQKLPNLRHLSLGYRAYWGKEMVCSSMGFPKLQGLKLMYLINLETWRVDEGAMPNLSSLEVSGCQKLKMLPEGLSHLKALKSLKMSSMLKSFTDRIKEVDGARGQDMDKVSHIPNIIITI
ncbi:hypothetical protein DCAR_0209679 [Daucus carota subsp. sativus]|uniref:AAA+ ATPase domain-containing protein n=1 Tax=Daucus carota subsp. sativus TaxID=79200 RepID=A0AAF1AS93_DAUCS|nr:hypothetical protein DCAR_0209679 [Daucus carota subsp. sativus]